MRIIAVTNQKGGTGKTTTVVNLGFALAQGGLRTLLVDLDAQGNLGIRFGIEGERSLYHILVEGADPNACAVNVRPNLDLIPSNETVAEEDARFRRVNISRFSEDIALLNEMVRTLRKRGYRRVSKSQIIRYGLKTVDLKQMPQTYRVSIETLDGVLRAQRWTEMVVPNNLFETRWRVQALEQLPARYLTGMPTLQCHELRAAATAFEAGTEPAAGNPCVAHWHQTYIPERKEHSMARQDQFTKQAVNRRQVLQHIAGTGAALALGFKPHAAAASKQDIQHMVLVMMENRSFDHFLGWVPGADGQQAGLTYLDRAGQSHATAPLAPDYQGCSHPDPDHSYDGGRMAYNAGACDGWLLAGENDVYAIGYYTHNELPLYAGLVQHWLTCDGYFAAIMAPSYPNRIYQHAAQTDRIDQSVAISSLPTIWDLLAAHGLQGRYYYTDLPTLALWGSKYRAISHPLTRFLSDCQAGTLPHVAFVDPRFVNEDKGTSWDDHPHADIRNGQAFVNLIYQAVVSSPNWPNTVLVITYDEWGGFFDHVPPPAAPIPPADQEAGNQDGLRGFRVPNFIVSPWTPRGTIGHGLYDHTSVLRMIEWRWELPPLSVRDATANNLADLLDFSHTNLEAPAFAVPGITLSQVCPVASSVPNPWERLRQLARSSGFLTY